jgi:hypothetical protein
VGVGAIVGATGTGGATGAGIRLCPIGSGVSLGPGAPGTGVDPSGITSFGSEKTAR